MLRSASCKIRCSSDLDCLCVWQRITLLEKGAAADRISFEAQLAEARAATEGMYKQYEQAHARALALEEANAKLKEECDTANMARKYVEIEREALEKRLAEVGCLLYLLGLGLRLGPWRRCDRLVVWVV